MVNTINQVLSFLQDNALVSKDTFNEIQNRWQNKNSHIVDTSLFCKWLVTNKYVTLYQSELILQGKSDGLKVGPYRIKTKFLSGPRIGLLLAVDSLGRLVLLQPPPQNIAAGNDLLLDFYKNVEIAIPFHHAHVDGVIGAVKAGINSYAVRPFFEGESLSEILMKRPTIDPLIACRIFVQVLSGMDALQKAGLPCGNLDLDSIFLAVDAHQKHQRTVKISGACIPSFLPSNSPGRVGVNKQFVENCDFIDIFNIGRSFYYLLTGHEFSGSYNSCNNESEIAFNKSCQGVSDLLIAFIKQMLDEDLSGRISNAGAAGKALRIIYSTLESEVDHPVEEHVRRIGLEVNNAKNFEDHGANPNVSDGGSQLFEDRANAIEDLSGFPLKLLNQWGISVRELVFMAFGAVSIIFILLICLLIFGNLLPLIALGLGGTCGYYLTRWLESKSVSG